MATVITKECINCGACEPECPNTAIYAGTVPWQMGGATQPALSDEFFYIVPEKCSECVGFFDHEACAAVCPVDCCVPDPDRPETEAPLLARARALHPETVFAEPPPSRFRKARPTSAAAVVTGLAPKAPSPGARPDLAQAISKAAAGSAAAAPTEPAVAAAVNPAAAKTEAGKAEAKTEPEATAKPAAKVEAKPEAKVETKREATLDAKVDAGAKATVEPTPADLIEDFAVPMLCRNCCGEYALPFRALEPGANLRCPLCRVSHSPTQQLFLMVGDRLRRYAGDLDAAAPRPQRSSGDARIEKAKAKLRRSLDRDLRAISAKLSSRPKRSWLGLS